MGVMILYLLRQLFLYLHFLFRYLLCGYAMFYERYASLHIVITFS